MKRLRKRLFKLLFPPVAVVVLLVPVAAALLLYTFLFGSSYDRLAYFSYALSAYALTVVCVRVPRIIKGITRIKAENRYVHQYLTDEHLRVKLSLYGSLGINILYALLQLGSGLYYRSIWFYALAAYYVLLALMRFFLLRDVRKSPPGEDLPAEFKRYRFCGILLLLVNLALSVIVTYIVWQNRGFSYNEIVTIAMAAYSFFSITVAILNVLKYRRHESPVMLAVKSINLTAALVSLLSLETAMLTAFGAENGPEFRRIMTASTGGTICVLVLAMAIYMIVRSTKERHRLSCSPTKSAKAEADATIARHANKGVLEDDQREQK